MLPQKRKRTTLSDNPDSDEDTSSSDDGENSDHYSSDGLEDEEAAAMKQSIKQKHIYDGAQLLKKATKSKNKVEVGGGSFQSMGLHPSLLRALTMRGYRTPTPIQRVCIPALLSTPPRDLVGMARTGSGKTLAYMIPLLNRLGGTHSSVFGARALILVPTRELAIQVIKVGKELARGWSNLGSGTGTHAGDADEERTSAKNTSNTSLRWALVVGGEGLDEQFEAISSNPDIIIATPGRLLHLLTEMSMSLASVSFVVFDEADRLFELGFDTALTEILSKLPNTRQTLLFSATLPKSLVEFAKAGLKDPKLVRLDKEGKMSEELRMCFWSVKENEKDAALLGLLRDVIGVPFKKDQRLEQAEKGNTKKKNARAAGGAILLLPHQTLVFTATKHHVEYISHLLSLAGYAVSYIYGTLDQAARSHQLSLFLAAKTSVLVVTDIAARGIDIPVLENVINYDFPVGARVFVHRVGRTARMGRKGWAWSFVGPQDLPYLIDLQLFLGKPLVNRLSISSDSSTGINESAFVSNMLLSPLPRDVLDQDLEYIHQTLDGTNFELVQMRSVMERGQKMYDRSKGKASAKSYSRAKEMTKDPRWGFTGTTIQDGQGGMVYSVLQKQRKPRESRVIGQGSNGSSGNEDFIQEEARLQKEAEVESQRSSLLLSIARFQPSETVFELGSRGKTPGAQLMKGRRKALGKAQERSVKTTPREAEDSHDVAMDESGISGEVIDVEMADEQDIQDVFGQSSSRRNREKGFRDEEFYLSHYHKDAETDRGYSLRDGASFAEQASHVAFDLTNDEAASMAQKRRQSQVKWDRKKKKFVKGDGIGADNVKLIKTESGTKLPSTYKSGRYEEWKSKNHRSDLKVGEMERNSNTYNPSKRAGMADRFKHSKKTEAKPLDKLTYDYERKMRVMKKKEGATFGEQQPERGRRSPGGKGGKAAGARWKGKSPGQVKNELRTVHEIRKQRNVAEKRRAKNARAPKKGKGRR